MFELTNDQRKCFGLLPVESHGTLQELKASPYDNFQTYAYLDGNVIRKCILCGRDRFAEYELCEELSKDGKYLLPKTAKGKPVLLSSSTLLKRNGVGMYLSYFRSGIGYVNIDVYNHISLKGYYSNEYVLKQPGLENDFSRWVEHWCSETTQEDREDIARFAAEPRKHVKFREGDVFRFKIDRRLYGYGRILLDYDRMRKNKEPFWDIMMGKPLAVSVYHIVTERADVTVEELKHLKALPSVHMMDNRLYYGEYEIIGNIPIGEHEDYPIMYGDSFDARYRAVSLQCGKLYRRDDNGQALYSQFANCSIGFGLGFKLPMLLECIAAGSNEPYWAQPGKKIQGDLRNPKFRTELEQICKQFDIEPSQLIN